LNTAFTLPRSGNLMPTTKASMFRSSWIFHDAGSRKEH
jgi:hypothetical protein